MSGSVVLVEPDIELSDRRRRHGGAAQGVDRGRAHGLYPQAARAAPGRRRHRAAPDFDLPDDAGPETRLRQLHLLNQAVSMSILNYGRPGQRLRNKHGKFDWTPRPRRAELREATGADYALFTYVRDSYTSGGRAAMRVIGFLLLGGDIGGGMQVGVASLVDLRTGQVVWHNLLVDQTGDLRDAAGARETAGDLLKGIRQCRRHRAMTVRASLARPGVAPCSPAAPRRRPMRDERRPAPRPVAGTDEAELWYAMERAERELQRSPLRVRDPALNAYVRGRRVQGSPASYCRDLRVYIDGRAAVQREHGAQRHDDRAGPARCCACATRPNWRSCSATKPATSARSTRCGNGGA